MSLKNFHVFFIAVSVITTVAFGLWCFVTETGAAVAGSKVMGAVSLLAAVTLVIYGVKFLQTLHHEGIK